MAIERDRAERLAAAAAERARLARAVHDGVLQVLALVQRRGSEAGGDLADLGRLAGEQESALRALIRRAGLRGRHAGDPARPRRRAASAGGVSTAGGVGRDHRRARCEMEAERVREVVAAVRACLDNVARARREPRHRPGCCWRSGTDRSSSRCATRARASPRGGSRRPRHEGRLGVTRSIRGRVADLAGTARLSTGALGHRVGAVRPARGTGCGRVAPMEDEPIRVMVVDDHPMWRDAVERDLTEAGFDVVAVAATGSEALARFPAARPRSSCSTCRSRHPTGSRSPPRWSGRTRRRGC